MQDALQWVLWFAIMGAVMAWLARSRGKPGEDAADRLVHPTSTLVVGIVCTLFFTAIAVLSAVFPGSSGSPWITAFFAGFALMGVPVVLDWRNGRHALLPGGMRYGRMFGGGGELRWSDVRAVRFSEAAKWFRLELADGRVVRISAMLRGLPAFAAAVLAGVPASALDEPTRGLLESTAAGDLPRIWG
jgi:hypothetical protein